MSVATASPIASLDPNTSQAAAAMGAAGSSPAWASKWFIWPLVGVVAGTVLLWVVNPKIVRKHEDGKCTGKPDIIKCLAGGLLLGLVAVGAIWLLGNKDSTSGATGGLKSLLWIIVPIVAALLVMLALWWWRPAVVCHKHHHEGKEVEEIDWLKVILGALLVGGLLMALLYATGFCR